MMVNYSSGLTKSSEPHFSRDSELRHSTGSIKGKRTDSNMSSPKQLPSGNEWNDQTDGSHSVLNLIKNFQPKVVNGSTKRNSNGSSEVYSYQSDSYKTPGYVAETPAVERVKRATTKRKLSLRYKKGRITADDARFNILQSLGMSPFAGNEGRGEEKAFAYFDAQSLFFAFLNAATLKLLYEEGSSYTKKLTGASAASARSAAGRKRVKSGEFDPVTGRFRSRTESILDEGDDKENHLVLKCPYFRNEVADVEDSEPSTAEPTSKHGKDISKLISIFNRNRSFENLRNDLYDHNKRHSRSRREFQSSEQDILLEETKDDSIFLTWDEPKVSGKRIFDFEHIDRGAMYYREYFADKDHINLFGIDEKYGPMAISIIREVIPKMAVLGHNSNENNEKNKKYHYRIIVRTCELYALRITVLENSIPSTSRHGGSSRGLPVKDLLEYCFPQIQHSCLRHAVSGPKISEQLIKLDEQQLTLKYKIGLIYCKSGQTTEEEMYNNEKSGSEFLEFCSVIADKVALKGFQGYRAQLDNKNDSTGAHSLYTTFHGREIMFHVSTELPFTGNDRQQLLRKRHIGNDIVTVIFQEPGCVPFTPQMMRSHFQHVFIVVRVENPHTEYTKYQVAVSRSRDVPYFGPPIPPDNFNKNAAFREFLLSKLINAENAAHKSDKFTHMARRTRYEYLKDLASNQVSSQTIENVNKFAFSFGSKKKEKSHPPVSPEIWLQGGMVWTVKFDFEHDGPGSSAYISISTKSVVFVEQSTQELILSIPCKSVLGWRPTSHTLKLFYDNGKMAYFSLCDDDLNELPYVVNRLKAVTPGCETQDLSLRRNNDGQLGFHVFYEGLVAEVEPYGLAWQSGLRKGSRLLEISGHVVGSMSHERMILMLKRPGLVRIVVLPPAPDGQPRNYRAVRNLRRYSSMTSVYSMSAATLAGVGDSSSLYSSKEYLTGSPSGSSPQQENTPLSLQKDRSFSAGGISRKESQNSSSSRSSDSTNPDLPNQPRVLHTDKQKNMELCKSTERLIASRSATDIPATSQLRQLKGVKKQPVHLPSQSVEQELGEIERQLTDTRKSIDAKFYRSLANSPNPFFRHSKSSAESIQEPTEDATRPLTEEVFSEGQKNVKQPVAVIVARRASDLHYPIMNEKLNNSLSRENSLPSAIGNGSGQTEPLENEHAMRKVNRNSLEQAFENSQVPPTPTTRTKVPPLKPPRQFLRKSEPVDIEIDPKLGVISLKQTGSDDKRNPLEGNDNSYSDSSVGRSKSQENLDKDSDHGRKGHFVRTKVRDAKEIISERRSLRESPDMMRHETMTKSLSMDQPSDSKQQQANKINRNSLGSKQFFSTNTSSDLFVPSPVGSPKHTSHVAAARNPRSPQSSPRLTSRNNELVRVIDTAARNKSHQKKGHDSLHTTPSGPQPIRKTELRNNMVRSVEDNKLDDSLTETFAKLDAAFGFRSGNTTPPRDEKRKKKRSSRCRSRNFEPPTSDSSDEFSPDQKRRGSRTPRRQTPEEGSLPSLPKSEAEESLEAAISEFHMELSAMPEKTRSGSFTSAISSGHRPPPCETSSPSTTPRSEKGLSFNKISSHAHQATRGNDDHPPKIPVRTSRPQILIDHQKLKQKQLSFENKNITNSQPVKENRKFSEPFAQQRANRVRSEAKVSITSRPWSPPLSRPQKSSYIKENIKECSSKNVAAKVAAYDKKPTPSAEMSHDQKMESSERFELEKSMPKRPELSKLYINNNKDAKENNPASQMEVAEEVVEFKEGPEDQLSPLPRLPITPNRGGIHSLPNRSKKRRMTVSETTLKSSSASCIPLLVRGLDLAAIKDSSSVPWSKEDLHVMIAVMENELAQEREEKERLSQELNRSREEKERLLEQSKQAASQLRKFTSLFLDASPQELEKAKQRYSDGR